MKTRCKNVTGIVLVALVGVLAGCRAEDYYVAAESQKAIEGSWKIVKFSRNGTDMTERVNGEDFVLTFHDENGSDPFSYSIESRLPFVVSKNGSWAFDDPTYPFAISFSPEDGSGAREVPFLFPVMEGERRINLSFSPGCSENNYEYILEKSDNP